MDSDAQALPTPHVRVEKLHHCPGYNLTLPTGRIAYASYPFLIHTVVSLPSNINIEENKIMLRSHQCTRMISKDSLVCFFCKQIHDHSVVAGLCKRQLEGTHEKTPWAYLTPAEMYSSLQRKSARETSLKFKALNAARKLNTRN
jgi:hypothetical protein